MLLNVTKNSKCDYESDDRPSRWLSSSIYKAGRRHITVPVDHDAWEHLHSRSLCRLGVPLVPVGAIVNRVPAMVGDNDESMCFFRQINFLFTSV